MKHAASQRSGFTIVEVVLAMGILLVGMTSVLGLLAFGAAMSRTAQLRNAAASAAEGVVADLEESLFPLVRDPATGAPAVGPPRAIADRPVPGHPGVRYSATAVGDPTDGRAGGPLRWRVDVRMSWTASGHEHEQTFSTLLLREVPFGERLRREREARRTSAASRGPQSEPHDVPPEERP